MATRQEYNDRGLIILGMTDPTAQEDMVPPPKPPRPTQQRSTSTTQRQLEADEMYARRLAEHYNSRRGPASDWQNDPRYHQPRGGEEAEDKEYNFFDGNVFCRASFEYTRTNGLDY